MSIKSPYQTHFHWRSSDRCDEMPRCLPRARFGRADYPSPVESPRAILLSPRRSKPEKKLLFNTEFKGKLLPFKLSYLSPWFSAGNYCLFSFKTSAWNETWKSYSFPDCPFLLLSFLLYELRDKEIDFSFPSYLHPRFQIEGANSIAYNALHPTIIVPPPPTCTTSISSSSSSTNTSSSSPASGRPSPSSSFPMPSSGSSFPSSEWLGSPAVLHQLSIVSCCFSSVKVNKLRVGF